ncbi:hypothetical protein ACWGID_39210 [Kribbella sp. NPDC054772]
MTERPPERNHQLAPHQPPAGYSEPPASGYPQPPGSGYPQPPGSGYPQPPGSGYPQPPGSGYPQQPGSGYPQHLWPEHAQARAAGPGGVPVAAPRATGSAVLGVLALVLGFAGVVAPLLPFSNLIDRFPIRQYLAFPFAVPALALAIACLAGNRRGKAAAAIGMIFAVLALIVGAIMVYNYDFRS